MYGLLGKDLKRDVSINTFVCIFNQPPRHIHEPQIGTRGCNLKQFGGWPGKTQMNSQIQGASNYMSRKEKMKIAFQGEHGAYSEQAIYRKFGREHDTIPCESLKLVFDHVMKGEVDLGVVPIENSIGGSIDETYDLLLKVNCTITGEIFLDIHHCLLASPGVSIQMLETVHSHPQALKQCAEYLDEINVKPVSTYDTAGAAKRIQENQSKTEGAIASKGAAEKYSLKILQENIESSPDNMTRFLQISKDHPDQGGPVEGISYKTSITFHGEDSPGSLYKSLKAFATRDINLTMIHSRPLKARNFRYRFYLDLEGHADDPKIGEALSELEKQGRSLQILGTYPSNHPLPS